MATAPSALLERDAQLEALREALGRALAGDGGLVLVGGEAGIGKTALVRAFSANVRADARILVGACDPLTTPRPLGPFVDVATEVGDGVAELFFEQGGANAVIGALIDELRRRPTVLVLEDLHWADEASLDLLRLLGRRVEATRALVVGTYRDDEVHAGHPLRLVLGELATLPTVRRLQLEPLTVAAVRVLAVLRHVDADELHRRTAGNPFFVTEVLASDGDEVPANVRDAVLARVARLPAEARRVLEVVSVMPGEAPLWVLERVAGDDLTGLPPCLASGVLVEQRSGIRFRHELARAAVESALDVLRRRSLHRSILEVLAEPPVGQPEPARLAHHADAAGDVDAVLRYAVLAAKEASARSAHRQAAGQLERALRFSSGLPDREVAALHDARMEECYLTEQVEEGLREGAAALRLFHALGDARKEGDLLRRSGRLHYLAGRADEARSSGAAAVALLETLPPGRELAMAYGFVAQMAQIDLDVERARLWAEKAWTLGERLGELEIVAYALTTAGIAEAYAGDPRARLRRSLALALEHGYEEQAARSYGALVFYAARRRSWADVDRWLDEGLRHAAENDLDGARLYLLGWQAYAAMARGRWSDATAAVTTALTHPDARLSRSWALIELAHIRARRGDPDVWPPLEELRTLIAHDTPQKHAPVTIVAIEAAFLAGDLERARREAASLPRVDELVDRWIAGELAVWRRRLGLPPQETGPVPEPYRLELSGDHEAAAERWLALDCRYDAGLALAGSDDETSLRRAHELFLELGARPAAAIVARRLRERGTRRVTRGPRRTTRANPAGLTARELDVMRLLAEGLRNAEIANRLFLSRRTVDHHVSAILRKLEASSRGEAVATAAKLGVLEDR